MLYTIGRDNVYRAKIEVWGEISKTGRYDSTREGYKGGCVFQTIDDAHRYIKERCLGEEEKFAVFGLDLATQWGVDTVPSDDGWWHHLLWKRKVLLLEETEDLTQSV